VEELGGLASSLAAGVSDVRGCLILSRDGLVLDSHPESGEVEARHAWMRLGAIGDPERGFAQFGAETWCFVRRGPYAAFAIVGPGARPGLVIDQMEQVLLAAEQARGKHQGMREQAQAGPAPTTKPRTPLHPESRPGDEPVVISRQAPTPLSVKTGSAAQAGALEGQEGIDGSTVPASSTEPTEPSGPPTRGSDGVDGPAGGDQEHPDVDRFSLAREFGQLLQDDETIADG
jgi:hypothetical protein